MFHTVHTLERHVFPNGKVIISAQGTTLTFQRPIFNLMQIELTGREDAALNHLFFGLLEKELAFDRRHAPRMPAPCGIEMFVDAQHVTRHGLMFEAWIQFLLAHRHQLRHIHILATNRVSQLSVEIMQHLSDTGDLVRLYDLPDAFAAALHAVAPASRSPIRQLHKTIDRLSNYLQHVPNKLASDGQYE